MIRKVIVFGTFDRLHPGHRYFLSEAEKRGNLYVFVAREKNVEYIKGHKPHQSELERLHAIQEAFPKACVALGDSDDYCKPIDDVQPDLILLGYDQCLPPGITQKSLRCPVERVDAFEPEKYKSSLSNNNGQLTMDN